MVKLSKVNFILFGFRKRKTVNFVLPAQRYIQLSLLNTRNRKCLIFLYCQLWLEGKSLTMALQSLAMFGWSWTDVSVLGSQVFGQVLMDSCDLLIASSWWIPAKSQCLLDTSNYPLVGTDLLLSYGCQLMDCEHFQLVACGQWLLASSQQLVDTDLQQVDLRNCLLESEMWTLATSQQLVSNGYQLEKKKVIIFFCFFIIIIFLEFLTDPVQSGLFYNQPRHLFIDSVCEPFPPNLQIIITS